LLYTLIGAALAFVANAFFWPSWQFLNMKEFIISTLQANRDFLHEVGKFYREKNMADPSYKLCRKSAFLAVGNLNAAFQRMSQEPKQQQKNLDKIYEVVVLNNTFLSLTAALGTYIRHHKTTEASQHFENYIVGISANLQQAIDILHQKPVEAPLNPDPVQEAQAYLDYHYQKLADQS